MRKIRTIDLFCGCGGLSLGFQNAGFEILGAYDNWQPAVEVYRRNFKHTVEQADLADPNLIPKIANAKPDVIIGGPPCQDFSSAGSGKSNGERANLTRAYANLINSVKPKFFVFENVPRARLSKVFAEAKASFARNQYGLTEIELDAAYCGAPQTRKRLFLIGGLDEGDDFIKEDLLKNLQKKPLTMREYFGDELKIDFYFRVPTNYSRRGIFSVDAPCRTIRGIDRPIPKGYLGHKDDPVDIKDNVRGLTVLERSRVQTFPKDFVFVGSKTDLNTMIGNAVPVKLAEYVAKALKAYIKKNEN